MKLAGHSRQCLKVSPPEPIGLPKRHARASPAPRNGINLARRNWTHLTAVRGEVIDQNGRSPGCDPDKTPSATRFRMTKNKATDEATTQRPLWCNSHRHWGMSLLQTRRVQWARTYLGAIPARLVDWSGQSDLPYQFISSSFFLAFNSPAWKDALRWPLGHRDKTVTHCRGPIEPLTEHVIATQQERYLDDLKSHNCLVSSLTARSWHTQT